MSYELPVTYLQTIPLPQLPLSTAGLPSQSTGVSQVPLTVMAVAHIFIIPEYERPSSLVSASSPSFRTNNTNAGGGITNDEAVTKRKRVTLVIDPIASYTKDLDVAVARCVAASGVTSLRFQNEQALFGLRTSLHPLDIIVSHSSPADCIRVLPSLLSWYKPASNVLAATDNPQGWKAVLTRSGQPPLPATYKLQHEMPQDHTWYVNPYFSLTPPDDPEQGAQDWYQLAQNATPNNNNNRSFTSASSPSHNNNNNISIISNSNTDSQYFSNGGRPPLGPIGNNDNNNSNSVMSPLRAQQQDIAWLLPHAKKDGGASERAASTLLTLERQRGEVAATQLEMVRASLDAEKTAARSQKLADESEKTKLAKRIKDLENELRALRFERVANVDSVQQLTYALHSSKAENQNIQDTYRRQQDGLSGTKNFHNNNNQQDQQLPEKLQTEPLMISRPESLGPLPTSLQNAASGPSDAEVLAALMIQTSLKPSSSNGRAANGYYAATPRENQFSAASASPIASSSHMNSLRSSYPGNGNIGQRGPSPISKRVTINNEQQQQQKPPPSPLVVESILPTNALPDRPAWSNVLGDTPQDRNLDPYGLTNSETAFSNKDKKDHAQLVRNLLVKNSMPGQIERMGWVNDHSNNNNNGSGFSSRSSTPTRILDNNNNNSASRGGQQQQHETTSANYKQQANKNIRGSPRVNPNNNNNNNNSSVGRQQRAASPLNADQGRAQATTASLYNLSNHIKTGRKLIQDLRA